MLNHITLQCLLAHEIFTKVLKNGMEMFSEESLDDRTMRKLCIAIAALRSALERVYIFNKNNIERWFFTPSQLHPLLSHNLMNVNVYTFYMRFRTRWGDYQFINFSLNISIIFFSASHRCQKQPFICNIILNFLFSLYFYVRVSESERGGICVRFTIKFVQVLTLLKNTANCANAN